MITKLKYQPRFKLHINDVDCTADILEVSLDQQQNLITALTFSVAKGIIYLDSVQIGYRVTLYAGTLDDRNFKLMFVGNVQFIHPKFKPSGVVEVSYMCYSSQSNLKKDIDRVVYYPATSSPRKWAEKDSLKASTIISEIVSEMGMAFGKFNDQRALILPSDKEFTLTDPIKQNLPDWGFLRLLANKLNCVFWEQLDPEDGRYKIYFVDSDIVNGDVSKDTSFYFLARDGGYQETLDYPEGSIQLKSFSCQEDSSMMTRNMRTVSVYDKDGNAKELFLRYDEESGEMYYYQLNYDRLNALPPEEQSRLMELISNSQFLHEGVDVYYDKIKITKEMQGSADWFTISGRPDMGVEATISFAGDVNIQPHRYYPIYGVSNRYSSSGSTKTWYMKSLTHKFTGKGGYICTAKLYR